MNLRGAAALRVIRVNFDTLPIEGRIFCQLQGVNFMPQSNQGRGKMLELAWKILMKKEYLQSVLARPQVMRLSKPSRLTNICQNTAAK